MKNLVRSLSLVLLTLSLLPIGLPGTASGAFWQDQAEPKPAVASYLRGARELESRIVFKREGYVKGAQEIAISAAMLGGFEPAYVEFYLDGELLLIDHTAPFAATIDTGARTGKHTLMAIAVRERQAPLRTGADGSGGALQLNEEGFRIRIVEPQAGGYVMGRSAIVVEPEFDDEARLESAQIYVDDELVATLSEEPWEFVFNFGRSFNARRIRVIAFDNFGRRAEAQVETAPFERSTIFVESRIVTIDVTATDDRGKFLGGLTAEDFQIFDNGEPQEIRYFSTEERPIWAAILIDTSGSMLGGKIRRSIFAAQQFISQLKPADHAMVMTFGPDATLVSDFTDDFPGLIARMNTLDAVRNALTPLNQGIYTALDKFNEKVGRRAIIVISDGADTASQVTVNEVYESAKRADVRIYAVAIEQIGELAGASAFRNDEATTLLRGLADVTGGDAFFPTSSSAFLQIFKDVATELRSQYALGYTAPQTTSNAWREIQVNVRNGLARAKQGYYPDEY